MLIAINAASEQGYNEQGQTQLTMKTSNRSSEHNRDEYY